MKNIFSRMALIVAAIAAIMCLAPMVSADVLYFEDFEVEAGTPLTDLGFTDIWNQGSEVADTAELGLAFDSRVGDGGPYFPSMDLPVPEDSMSRYEVSVDMYVDATTRNNGIQIFTNPGNNDSWAFIRHNQAADTWDASMWYPDGSLNNYTVLTGGGSGVYNVKFVVDISTMTMWGAVDGNETGHLDITGTDLSLFDKIWITDDPRDSPGAVFDNLLVECEYDYSQFLPGDTNIDGIVDAADAATLASNWQIQSGATWFMGDFNQDEKVDDADATLLATNWQTATSGSATVPEPGSLILLLGGLIALLALRTRNR